MAASLNGGNCLAAFVKMLQEWAVDLGLTINQGKIWEKTIALGTVYIRTVKFRYSKKVTKLTKSPPYLQLLYIEMYDNIRTVHSESSGVKLTRFQG